MDSMDSMVVFFFNFHVYDLKKKKYFDNICQNYFAIFKNFMKISFLIINK